MREMLWMSVAGAFAFALFACGDEQVDPDPSGGGDTTPPTVITTSPASSAVNVDAAIPIAVEFSESMDTASVRLSASPSIAFGAQSWGFGDTVLTLTPAAPLAYATSFTITVNGKDRAGNEMTEVSFTFTTGAPPDTQPPSVINNAPSGGALAVPITTSLSFTFSEPMNKETVEAAFSATPATDCVFLWDATATLMTCDPMTDLAYDTAYSATLGTGAKDAAGNALVTAHSFGFTTAAAPDLSRPTIVSVSPANLSRGAARSTDIVVTFSEPMDKASAQAAFAITAPTGFSGGVFTWDGTGTEMTYHPPEDFLYGASVAWQVSTTAEDLAGNALAETASFSFNVILSVTLTVQASPTLDGTVTDTGGVDSTSGTLMVGDYGMRVLDFSWNYAYRALLTFDLSPLNGSGLTAITSATLYVYQSSVVGTPYGYTTDALGNLIAESVDYGLSLEGSDYARPNLGYTYTLSTSSTTGLKLTSVTDKVVDDWANRVARGNRSQFRLRFDFRLMTFDDMSDNVTLSSAEDANALNRPRLSITYEVP